MRLTRTGRCRTLEHEIMTTPLGLRRQLLLTFPEIRAASVSIEHLSIVLRYVPDSDGQPAHEVVTEWIAKNKVAGIGVAAARVEALDADDGPRALLARTTLPLDLAEDADVTIGGITDFLRRRWQHHFDHLEEGVAPGCVTCAVAPGTPTDVQEQMVHELEALLAGVAVTIKVVTRPFERPHSTSRGELALADDWDRMHELCDDAVTGRHRPSALPPGVFAFLPTTQASLFCHLAVAERVYVEMPRTADEVSARYGVRWVEFLDAMSTGRVVPVFRQVGREYENVMIDAALDAGGTTILPGDTRLRELASLVAENPSIALASALDDRWRETHAAVRRHGDVQLVPFFDALAATADRARYAARVGEHMTKVWAPLAIAIGDALHASGHPDRSLELAYALDAVQAADGCGARPIIPNGDKLGRYVRFVCGVRRLAIEDSAPSAPGKPLVEEPPVVEKIVLERVPGISLRQFAESFKGPAIEAMHRLMQSPRLTGDRPVHEVVQEFVGEMHTFNGKRRRAGGVAAAMVAVATQLADLATGWGLLSIVTTRVARYLMNRSVLKDEQAAMLVGTPKEAAYMARIDDATKNR